MKNIKKLFIILFISSFVLYSQNYNNKQEDEDLDFSLLSYIENGNLKMVKDVVKKGANINAVDEDGYSTLHLAVKFNRPAILEFLLSHKKINVNPVLPTNTIILDNDGNKWYCDGETPLILASYYGREKLVSLLLNYGADIMARDTLDGAMAIHIACARGNTKTVATILTSYSARKVKGIVNIKDSSGATSLMWASMNNKIPTMNLLLKYSAKINEQDDDGWTALHFAAASESYKAVEFLVRNNANANITNKDGKKPLDLTKDTDLIALLEKYTKQ